MVVNYLKCLVLYNVFEVVLWIGREIVEWYFICVEFVFVFVCLEKKEGWIDVFKYVLQIFLKNVIGL